MGRSRPDKAMLNRLVTVLVLIPLAIVLVALAVANRASVAFTIDPFNPGNPGLTTSLPLFVLLFAALALGLVVGSLATWFRQGRYRKAARRGEAAAASTPAAKAGGAGLPAPARLKTTI
jgi:uncharacterized integral membrane protein